MGFRNRKPAASAPSGLLAQCAADYANAEAHRSDLLSNRDDANIRAAGSEAAASRTEQPKRGRWS